MNSLITVDAARTIDDFRSDLLPILSENGQSFDRLRSTFMIAVQQNPDILKCTPESLRREISKCAVDGLVPDSKEAVLLPYWDKEAKAYLANYQPMVYGIIKRMKELGSVFNIVCEIVCQTDTFVFNAADPDSLSHSWDVFSEQPRGATRAAYVIFRDDQKRVMHREIMTLAELLAVRQASKAPNSPAWRNFEGEMYQKAVLRRGSKYISINNDKIRAMIERQDDMFDYQGARTAERLDPFSGQTIDGEVQTRQQPRQERQQEPRQQQNDPSEDRRAAGDADRSPAANSGDGAQDKTEKQTRKEKPIEPPAVPDVDVAPMDKDAMVECAEKVLGIALNRDLDPPGRRGILKTAAAEWKPKIPEDLHELLRACIEMSDWAIQRASQEQAWAAEHAMFVSKVKTLLGVEKLNVGKYP